MTGFADICVGKSCCANPEVIPGNSNVTGQPDV